MWRLCNLPHLPLATRQCLKKFSMFSLFCSPSKTKTMTTGASLTKVYQSKARSPKELVPPIHPILPPTLHNSPFRSFSLSGSGNDSCTTFMVSFISVSIWAIWSGYALPILTSDVTAQGLGHFFGFWDSLTRQVISVFHFSAVKKKTKEKSTKKDIWAHVSYGAIPSPKQVCISRKECLFFFNGTSS
jgi:hypothetical protein